MKLLHTCLRVGDLEKSLKFYQDYIGLKEVRRKDYPEYEFALVYLSDETESYEIELTYNYGTKKYDLGNGFSHLAFGVDDVVKSHETHKEQGLAVTDLKGLPGEEPFYYFVTDPDGYQIEIIKNNVLV